MFIKISPDYFKVGICYFGSSYMSINDKINFIFFCGFVDSLYLLLSNF